MQWTTRTHWLWGFLIPSRFYLILTLMALAGFLIPQQWGTIAALLTVVVAFMGFAINWAQWHTFSLVLVPGERSILERDGFAMVSERRINLSMVGSMIFRQTLMGRLLDYGTLSIGALGGPYEWQNLGQFRTLRRIVESNGKWLPPQRTAIHILLHEWLHRQCEVLRRIWNNMVLQWHHRPKRNVPLVIHSHPSSRYGQFLRYVEMHLFPRSVLNFEVASAFPGITMLEPDEEEIRIYRHILEIRGILVVDSRGRFFRHLNINTMEDVRRLIPIEWFERYMRQYDL